MTRDIFGNQISTDFLGRKPKKASKRKSISFTKKVKLWEMNKQHLCHICKQKISSLTEAELDHIRAHAKGGTAVSWTHRACNRMKGKKSLSQIQKELGVKRVVKKRKKKATRKTEQNDYWVNPLTGKKEKAKPLFPMFGQKPY